MPSGAGVFDGHGETRLGAAEHLGGQQHPRDVQHTFDLVGRTCGQCFGGSLRQLQPGDGPGDVERRQAHDGDPGIVGRHNVEDDLTVGHRGHDEQVGDVAVQNGTARAGEYGAAAVTVRPHRRRGRIAVARAGNRERADLFSAEQSLE